MPDMSDRIKQLMKEQNIRATKIADLTGTSKGTVSQWVNGGTKPLGDNLLKLSRALRCRPQWLTTGEGAPYTVDGESFSVAEFAAKYNIDPDPGLFAVRASDEKHVDLFFAKIPKLNIELSAGHGADIQAEDENGFLYFRRDWISKKGLDENKLCVVYVKGDSMEPTINHGEVILVDTSEHYTYVENVDDGFIYAINIDNDAMVKRLFKKPGGGIIVRSDSGANQYKDMILEKPDLQYLRIIGRAIWHAGDL